VSESDTPQDIDASSPTPVLRAYGVAGDISGARRSRRAFRFCVATVVAFTGVLFLCEQFLRYDRSETQYISALTLPDSSARAILRNVVKRDTESQQVPTAKYVEALANIEEEDVLLERYEEAYRLNPNSPSLSINYGCRLFQGGQYLEARERFREASIQPQKNALPRYLEAAALAASTLSDEDIGESLALIARTNNSGLPLVFPEPLWHPSLPASGQWHTNLRRAIVDRCCGPLYQFKNILVGRARMQLAAGRGEHWEGWLGELDILGEQLIGDLQSPPESVGIPQAIAGIEFQLEALELRGMIGANRNGLKATTAIVEGGDKILERRIRLNTALETLGKFENRRISVIGEHSRVLHFPMLLCLLTGIVLFGIYFILFVATKALGIQKQYWTLRHAALGVIVISGGLLLLLLMLAISSGFVGAVVGTGSEVTVAGTSDLNLIAYSWGFIILALIVFGLFYPSTALISAEEAISELEIAMNSQEDPGLEKVLPVARQSRRHAALTLIRRYYGILFGGFLCIICLWAIGYRVLTSLYPTQLAFLTTGLEEQELAVIRQVQEFLSR
jgi:tetratricopeptide (TPR) repeat protein